MPGPWWSLFDYRMKVSSPGGLLPEIRMDDLRARARVHQSRNPRIVRALVDLGFMRDQGEGIPRLFAEMEGFFLPEPELEATGTLFLLTLRTFSEADSAFLASLGSEELSDVEFRALLEALRHGVVDNARMRQMAGLDTLGASRVLRSLRDRNLLLLHGAAAGSYYELSDRFPAHASPPHASPSALNSGESSANGGEPARDGRELPSNGGESVPAGEDPLAVQRRLLQSLGKKPRKDKLRSTIESLLSARWWTPRELAEFLRRDQSSLVEDHLGPMTQAGKLRRLHAEANHPEQAYRLTQESLFTKESGDS